MLLSASTLPGCTAFPSVGPTADVIDPGDNGRQQIDYEVFDINSTVLSSLQHYHPISLSGQFGQRAPAPREAIGVGDQVAVSIFEAGNQGTLFATASASSTSSTGTVLPLQTVDRDGRISVPYAGRIQAAGRTPDQVSQAVVAALESKASQPQAIVSVVKSAEAEATVIGDATGAGRIPLSLKGDRLLEVIAQAGGVRTMPQETYIRLLRGRAAAGAYMRSILANPRENVFVYPGDTIYVYRNTPKFTVLGAVTTQKDYMIDQDHLTLAEAVARSGGLNDIQADSSAVFLFRYESPEVVRAINPRSKFLDGRPQIAVVYRLSFQQPNEIFYAQRMLVEDNDLLYIANAPVVQLTKFVTLARGIASVSALTVGKASIAN